MDLHKIIFELQSEKQRLDEAIQALERLSSVAPGPRKRGRPPIHKHIREEEPPPQAKAQAKS